MQSNISKTKIYSIEWEDSLFLLSLHFNDEGIVTNHFRPPDLEKIMELDPLIYIKNEEEFLHIWTKYLIGLIVCSPEKDIIERNIGALTFVVMDSTINNNYITFYDLLNYLDCFSMMLNEQGFSKEKIKQMYIPVTKALLLNFKNKIIDSMTGETFITTSKYKKIFRNPE